MTSIFGKNPRFTSMNCCAYKKREVLVNVKLEKTQTQFAFFARSTEITSSTFNYGAFSVYSKRTRFIEYTLKNEENKI